MNKSICTKLFISIIILSLSSCATGPSRSPKPVPPGYLYEGSYINVRAPDSEGWHLLKSSPAGMDFARSGAAQGESFAAQVNIFPLAKTNSNDEFLSFIKNGFENDMDPNRFEIVESNFKYSENRKYPCIEVDYVIKDNQAQVSPARKEMLLLQGQSVYCRHPVRQETGFAIIYSHRGKSEYPNFNVEAEEFINGVQVPTP